MLLVVGWVLSFTREPVFVLLSSLSVSVRYHRFRHALHWLIIHVHRNIHAPVGTREHCLTLLKTYGVIPVMLRKTCAKDERAAGIGNELMILFPLNLRQLHSLRTVSLFDIGQLTGQCQQLGDIYQIAMDLYAT